MKTKGLGRGLSALISDRLVVENDSGQGNILEVPTNSIKASTWQPRRIFSDQSLYELANSIRKNGIIQPIIVVKSEIQDEYRVIAGERRWRAARIVGLTDIPVIIRDLTSQEILEYSIIENIQREDLTPIEEADAYIKLMQECGYTQEELSSSLGKSRSHIANIMRLSSLPDSVKGYLNDKKISKGHAKLLVGLDNAKEIADSIIAKELNVRQAEKLIQSNHLKKTREKNNTEKDIFLSNNDLQELQNNIAEALNLEVKIDINSNNKGKVVINFTSMNELDDIVQKLT